MNTSVENALSSDKRLAFVQASWHKDIVEQSRFAFASSLGKNGIDTSFIDVIHVPGSLEIPLQCQRLARTDRYQAIIAAGLIVDGGIYRHDFVASTVLDGMMRVSLDTDVPILSLVLTPHHFHGQEHHDFFFDHFRVKGEEAAQACLKILSI